MLSFNMDFQNNQDPIRIGLSSGKDENSNKAELNQSFNNNVLTIVLNEKITKAFATSDSVIEHLEEIADLFEEAKKHNRRAIGELRDRRFKRIVPLCRELFLQKNKSENLQQTAITTLRDLGSLEDLKLVKSIAKSNEEHITVGAKQTAIKAYNHMYG